MFHLMFVHIILVRFALLSDHLLVDHMFALYFDNSYFSYFRFGFECGISVLIVQFMVMAYFPFDLRICEFWL